MAYSDEVGKVVAALKKQGKAVVTVTLVPYANDLDFTQTPPSSRVTVTVRDPGDGNRIVRTETADISTNAAPYSHQFTVSVQTVVKSLGRFIGFPQHRSLDVEITAEPINGYEVWYAADKSVQIKQVQAGSDERRNVSLRPTYEGSRLNALIAIAKPKLQPPNHP